MAESKYYFFQNLLCTAAPVFRECCPNRSQGRFFRQGMLCWQLAGPICTCLSRACAVKSVCRAPGQTADLRGRSAVSACFRLVHTGSYLVVLDVAAWSGSGSHHLNNGVCFWLLKVNITSFRTSFALLLQYFESAVPTDRSADSLDIDCFADNWQSFL